MFTRSPGFTYKNNELHCDELPINQLAKKFGTPLYLYSATAIRERYRTLEGAFHHVRHTRCYSVKANSNLSILRLLAGMGAGFDIVSGGELERVRRAQKKALHKVVFSGVGKTADELKLALRNGILLFNLESEGEIELLARCATELRKTASVALRVNPDVPAETHPYISTGLREHKFGVAMEDAPAIYRRISDLPGIVPEGVSCHIGSQLLDTAPLLEAARKTVGLVGVLRAEGLAISHLDLGGGIGVPYRQ